MANQKSMSDKLLAIETHIVGAEARRSNIISAARPEWQASLRNLIHYMALRELDIRKLQLELADHGLSSLGRAEGYVLGNLRKVRRLLAASEANQAPELVQIGDQVTAVLPLTWSASESLLHTHTRAIFGPKPPSRHVYIMVTAPSADIADEPWLRRMLKAGMNILRINAAHGTLDDWRMIAERARRASKDADLALRIAVDLPGPKLRTLALSEGAHVLKLQPQRDEFGRVTTPCQVRIGISVPSSSTASSIPLLPIPAEIESKVGEGDLIEFEDTRGRPRSIRIKSKDAALGIIGELDRTAYIGELTELHIKDASGTINDTFVCKSLPAKDFSVLLAAGDKFILCSTPAEALTEHPELPLLGCTLPAIFGALKSDMAIMFDDGKIVARIETIAPTYSILRLERAARGTARLRGDMGINIPDAELKVPAFTDADSAALNFAEEFADIVSLSFIRSVEDVRTLERQIRRPDIGLIIKIETRAGFEAIPAILLEFLGKRNLALMIARGDLAIEIGFARLAEVQEEILWLAEAAHIPVVWATQVLESLAKTGFPTRSEVTDAAMSVRAECVMLNKGPFIEDALHTLDSILVRMEAHQYKKRQLYRPLKLVSAHI